MLEFITENAFTVSAALFVVGILFFLFWKLFRSYPLIFVGLVATIGAGVMAMKDGNSRLGFLWIIFAVLTTLFSGLYWYKNIKGCFWWGLGALFAMPLAGLPVEEFIAEENTARLVGILIPVGFFFVVGLVGSLVFPRVIHKKKDERKHLTNTDRIIGRRVTITSEKNGENPQRALIGDVDWAVAPLYSYETFKVGDVVKVLTIKGVTLLCTRDMKDSQKEIKEKRKQENKEAKAKAEAKRKAKEAQKAEELAKKEAEEAAKKAAEAKAAEEAAKKAAEEARAAEEAARKAAEAKEAEEAARKAEEEARAAAEEAARKAAEEQAAAEEEAARKAAEEEAARKAEEEAKAAEEAARKAEEEAKAAEEAAKKAAEEQAVLVEPVPAPKAKAEFVPFAVRLQQADPFVRDAYNELKSEVLSYGIKSRVSSTGDTFRLHTKTYVKMVVAGKYLKLYLALDPADYKDSTYPFEDASKMGAHSDAPFVFKIKSGLSVRRAKILIGDAAKKDNLEQGEVAAHNHAADVAVE